MDISCNAVAGGGGVNVSKEIHSRVPKVMPYLSTAELPNCSLCFQAKCGHPRVEMRFNDCINIEGRVRSPLFYTMSYVICAVEDEVV